MVKLFESLWRKWRRRLWHRLRRRRCLLRRGRSAPALLPMSSLCRRWLLRLACRARWCGVSSLCTGDSLRRRRRLLPRWTRQVPPATRTEQGQFLINPSTGWATHDVFLLWLLVCDNSIRPIFMRRTDPGALQCRSQGEIWPLARELSLPHLPLQSMPTFVADHNCGQDHRQKRNAEQRPDARQLAVRKRVCHSHQNRQGLGR